MDIAAILFVITVSLGIIVIVIKKFYSMIMPFLRLKLQEKIFKKKEKILNAIDEDLKIFDDKNNSKIDVDNEKINDLFKKFHAVFCLDDKRNAYKHKSIIYQQNYDALEKLVTLSEKRGSYIKNLKELETNLENYLNFINEKYSKEERIASLIKKHEGNKKSLNWAVKNLKKEIKDIEKNIKENKKAFFINLEKCFKDIKSDCGENLIS